MQYCEYANIQMDVYSHGVLSQLLIQPYSLFNYRYYMLNSLILKKIHDLFGGDLVSYKQIYDYMEELTVA